MRRRLHPALFAASLASLLPACNDEPVTPGIDLASDGASVHIALAPFVLEVKDAEGRLLLSTLTGASGDAYGAPAVTLDSPIYLAQTLPGWDGYQADEAPWRHATRASLRARTDQSATVDLDGDGVKMSLEVKLEGAKVRLHVEATGSDTPNKTTLSFESSKDEHFFGMGERFATTDHRSWSLYSWAEEGALGKGENAPASAKNPFPSGPSMTYFPVPFFLSSHGYGVHLATSYRTEVNFASDRDDAWRFAVNATRFDATVYVHGDPLATLDDYTADTGRPTLPTPWIFGLNRRVDVNATVNGSPEWQLMREKKIACTAIDDSVHFLPALSQTGKEQTLATWTKALHGAGYKVMAYNNPYVAEDNPNAAADYAYGKAHGYFVKRPDGEPVLTQFISGKLLTVAAVDFTNPAAVSWYQGLLKRSLDLGYDGWMHDFGEYTPRDAVFFDGRRGDEMHNEYPVLSAKAAHDLMEKERPGDYEFYVRSGASGTQAFVPAVWGGDAEATFDETLGLPSALRGGVNLSMSGVPYWGSDMTGFKCITDFPNDKEVFLRWVEFGAVSPFMLEENACSNPLGGKKKWTLWSDEETTAVYARYALLHTRLFPYFMLLAKRAHESGKPITLHPFLLHPTRAEAWAVDDAYYLGSALYVSPVVRRGKTAKSTWLPPGRFVDLDDYSVYAGDKVVSIPAPLEKLPLLLVENEILPLLDPSIDTLAPATDPSVVTLERVADRLDVEVALGPGGKAELVLADGTELRAERLTEDGGNPQDLVETPSDGMADCASCFHQEAKGQVERLQLTGPLGNAADVAIADIRVTVKGGPERRVRWDVLRLP